MEESLDAETSKKVLSESSAASAPSAAEAASTPARNGVEEPVIGLRRLLVAIVMVAGGAELAYAIVNVSAMPVYIEANHLGLHLIGIVMTAYLLVEGLLKSPFGVLGDRIGRKPLILIGPIVSTFTSAITPLVQNPFALVGLRVLDGMGAAALWPSAFSLIGDHVPDNKRASAMSLFNLSYLLGIALGPSIGGNINDWAFHHFHWVPGHHLSLRHSKDASFYVASILFLITTMVAMAILPNVRPVHHDEEGHAVEGGFNIHDFVQMLGRMPAMLLMTFVTFLGIGLVMPYVKVFAMSRFGLSESMFGNYLMIPALIIALVSVPLGTIGDRIGKPLAVRIGIGLCAAAFWLLLVFPSIWNLIGMGTLIGVGFVMAFPAWMALVSEQGDPRQRGAMIGAVGTAQGIGAIFGAAASGFLYRMASPSLGFMTVPHHGLPFVGCAALLTVSFFLALTTIHAPKSRKIHSVT
ncbi:MAG TPA: MFS transporter [Chthonomonadaceae bacterium]|nr:MFS transporter [Chthonomonadaceae bacterium]